MELWQAILANTKKKAKKMTADLDFEKLFEKGYEHIIHPNISVCKGICT